MSILAQDRDQKGENYIEFDYSDFSIGKAHIDTRYKDILDLNLEKAQNHDIEHKEIFKRQLIEWLENFEFKKNELIEIVKCSKHINEMIEHVAEILEDKFRERELLWNKTSKDLIKTLDEVFISKISSYLATSFMELQKTLQNYVMQKTRWEDKDKYTVYEKQKITALVVKLNTYKNNIIESKTNSIIITLVWLERAKAYYPKMNTVKKISDWSYNTNKTKININWFIDKIKRIISNN